MEDFRGDIRTFTNLSWQLHTPDAQIQGDAESPRDKLVFSRKAHSYFVLNQTQTSTAKGYIVRTREKKEKKTRQIRLQRSRN
jgi:hypothetical protein